MLVREHWTLSTLLGNRLQIDQASSSHLNGDPYGSQPAHGSSLTPSETFLIDVKQAEHVPRRGAAAVPSKAQQEKMGIS